MAIGEEPKQKGGIWLIDSGYSNHMTCEKNLCQHIKSTSSHSIRVGDGKALKVEGIVNVTLCSRKGKITTLNDVQVVPKLAHNLLSVGEIMDSRFDIEFTRGVCNIKESKSKARVAQVCMTNHMLFPLEVDDVGYAYTTQNEDVSNL